MKILIIQHQIDTPPGNTLLWLEKNQVDFDITHIDSQPLPDPSLFGGLIVLGGGMNVDQESKYPWLRNEKAYISAWIESGKPIFGICLGGQLIAEVLGARVSPHEFWEIGWSDVEVLRGSHLPLEGKLIPAFQWHGYSFDIPEGGELVLKGSYWKNQGFKFKKHVLGIQFHPEADRKFIEDCAQAQRSKNKISETVLSHDQIMARLSDMETLKNWYFSVLDSHFLHRTPY